MKMLALESVRVFMDHKGHAEVATTTVNYFHYVWVDRAPSKTHVSTHSLPFIHHCALHLLAIRFNAMWPRGSTAVFTLIS